ncbi:MAG TPA: dihydrolipoamide acetyltransferase family protein [Candidatus Micrarchaeaceae archaeon]|nr:dihydrolipoamide acetyltransferase family protein [Candidatus Micrarchaeaceae archaeon]
MGRTTLKMPQLGESVTEGTVDRWLKQEGDMVRRDEPIVEVVTDKVNAEIPSPFEGRLVSIKVGPGETVAIGTALAEMEVEGAADAAAEPAKPEAAEPEAATPTTPAPRQTQHAASSAEAGDRVSPAVRRLLQDNDLELSQITGTGGGGRVQREDVIAYLAEHRAPKPAKPQPAAASSDPRDELVRISAVRRQIAEHMVRSVSTSPHAWALREVDVTNLVEYRAAQKAQFEARHGFPLSYVPFFIQIVCDALMKNPYLNSTWTEEGIILKHYVNMGIAVALPDTLIVPVIKDADKMGFIDLAHALNDLATRARNKTLRPEDVRGGTFTLNNTGALGSVAGQSIINQPQAAILSTESIRKRPVAVDDAVAIRPIMNLTMSFDHRIIDGLAASRFLNAVQSGIEEWTPASLKV